MTSWKMDRIHIEELFRDNRGGKPEIRKNIDGPKIRQSEIRASVSRMKGNKARGPYGLVIEMIKAVKCSRQSDASKEATL